MKLKMKFGPGKSAFSTKLAVVAVLLLAGSAHAAGWTKVAANITELGDAVVTVIIALCAVAGIGAIGYAGKLLLKKSGDRGDDVEWSKIGYSVFAGACLMSVAFLAGTSVETLGGSDIGGTVKIVR